MFKPRPAALAVTFTLLGALFIASCASRQPPRGGPPGGSGPSGPPAASLDGGQVARPVALLLAGMDRDGDHVIDRPELAAGILREWQRLAPSDRAGVPAVAMSDWAAQALGSPDALPNHIAFDTNLDGRVSEEEFRARLEDEFARLDRDHDGRLARAEMLVSLPTRSAAQAGGARSGPPAIGGRGDRPPR